MEPSGGNFGNIYVFGMGTILLWALIPTFLECLIAGLIMKIKGHQKKKRGLRIAGNIFLVVAGVVVLVFAAYCVWGYFVLH
ncbi:MAG: hypothetical protein J6U23_05765 [Clostridiales bacterium]|nr:hypothetical protein [Clostridiales bacterium]